MFLLCCGARMWWDAFVNSNEWKWILWFISSLFRTDNLSQLCSIPLSGCTLLNCYTSLTTIEIHDWTRHRHLLEDGTCSFVKRSIKHIRNESVAQDTVARAQCNKINVCFSLSAIFRYNSAVTASKIIELFIVGYFWGVHSIKHVE